MICDFCTYEAQDEELLYVVRDRIGQTFNKCALCMSREISVVLEGVNEDEGETVVNVPTSNKAYLRSR